MIVYFFCKHRFGSLLSGKPRSVPRPLTWWLASRPSNIDLVVGVPRSGLLVANLLSMYLNLAMTDVDGLLSGRILRAGARFRRDPGEPLLSRPRNVLIVDDSVSYGGQMALVRAEVAGANLPHRIHYAAAYITPDARDERLVDYFGEVVARPRVFEWNLMHHESLLARSCISLEGVILPAPSTRRGRRASGPDLRGVAPRWVPDHPVEWLLSDGPEEHRPETEAWLASQGVNYSQLLMRGGGTGATALGEEGASQFKAEIYGAVDAVLLLEASLEASCRVAALSGKPVYCITTREMVRPGMSPREGRRLRYPLAWWAIRNYHRSIRIPRLVAKRIMGAVRRFASSERDQRPERKASGLGRRRFPARRGPGQDQRG